MTDLVDYLLANPIFLVPLLLVAAMLVFAILKKLLKMAAIVVIAGVLYVLLVEYFGDDTPFLLESQVDGDWLRYYPSFTAALGELADARVFAGIHFRTACDDGVVLGGEVAEYILDNLMGRIRGEGE